MSVFSIERKVVVITGGSGVLGGSIARGLAECGARVVIIGRTQEKVDRKVDELKTITNDVAGYVGDVLDADQIRSVADLIIKDYHTIDVLINAAGGNTPGATMAPGQSVFDLDMGQINNAIELNLNGSIYPSLIFGRIIAENGIGSIINVSSMAAYSAITRVPAYAVAKSGINSFTQWMACEMALKYGDKVRVNAIAPGFFIGDQNRKLLLNDDGSLTDRSQKVINKTPMGRFGEITELNGAVQFLISPAASFITGAVIPVDGGFSAFSGV